MPKEVHLRQLATWSYQITPSWTPSRCMPEESDFSQRAAARPDALNLLSVVCSTLAKIQSKCWTHFPTLNTLKTSQTGSLNHRHLLRPARKHTIGPVLCWVITLLSHGNVMLRVALRQTYKAIPNTRLPCLKCTNISSVGSRRSAWRRTMTMCWKKNRPLCVSQASKPGMASRSLWITCPMIRLSRSGNCTLSRTWDGMTITNALSNTGVNTSSKAWDGWCSSQLTPSILFMPRSVAWTAIHHRNAYIPTFILWTGGGRHR